MLRMCLQRVIRCLKDRWKQLSQPKLSLTLSILAAIFAWPANRNRGAIISANRGKFVRLTLTPNIVANFGPKQLKIYEHKGLSNRNRYTEVRLVLIIGCGDIAQ